MLWNTKTGTKIHTCNHDGVVNSVAFSPGGDTFLTASNDNTAVLWDMKGTLLDYAASQALIQSDITILNILLDVCGGIKECFRSTTLHSICHAASKVRNYQPDRYKHMCDVAYLIIQKCIEQNCTFLLNATDLNGKTPLHWAAWYNLSVLVKLFIKAGIDIDALDNQACTPLHYAVKRNAVNSTYFLLEGGADPALAIDNDFVQKDTDIINDVVLKLILKYYVKRS